MNKIIAILLVFVSCLAFGQGATPNLRNGIDSYYRFERTSGSVIDEKQVNDATNNGATRGVTGKKGNGFSFDATNDNVSANVIISATGDFTINIWVKTSDTGITQNIFSQYTGGSAGRFAIEVNLNTPFRVFIDGATNVDFTGTVDIADNAWHMCTFTRSGNDFEIFVDGVSDGTQTQSGISVQQTGINFGYLTGVGQRYGGTLDEAIFYNRTLSQLEIDQHYNSDNAILFVQENFNKNKNYENLINYVLGRMYFGFITGASY